MKPTRFKFRAWDTDDLSMRHDIGITPGGYADAPWGKEKYDWPLMQWTGLYDKNGKEIYEGDILSAGDGGFFEVKFQSAGWHFCHTKASGYIAYPSAHSNASRMEVVGTIYENPELLEAQ